MIIFMGVAGAGKSVQGKLLGEALRLDWISVGELLRKQVGGHRKQEMLSGKLLDDQEIIQIINEFISSRGSDKFILDGFPRTIPQAEWLLAKQKSGEYHVKAVVHLSAAKDTVKKRLLKRGRPDDNETAINIRFDEYEQHTLPIVGWFKKEKIPVIEVNGEGDIDQIHQDIKASVSSL